MQGNTRFPEKRDRALSQDPGILLHHHCKLTLKQCTKPRRTRHAKQIVNSSHEEGVRTFMKNVQIVFNIQVPDHVSEEEVNSRLHQVIGSLMAQEFGGNSLIDQPMGHPPDGHDGQVGHA